MDLEETKTPNNEEQYLDRLFGIANFDCLASMAAGLIVAVTAWIFHAPQWAAFAVMIPIAAAVGRWSLARAYIKQSPPAETLSGWGLAFTLGAGVQALAWGVTVAIATKIELAPLLAVVWAAALGMVFFTVALYAGAHRVSIIFAALVLLPATISALFRLHTIDVIAAVGAVTAFVLAFFVARFLHDVIDARRSADVEKQELIDDLEQRRTQVEKLNVTLKTNTDKREQAEEKLRRATADLGLIQGKARALASTLERVSPLDQVTELANRRHFDDQLNAEWRRATREQKPISLLLVCIDEFAAYRENYGSQSADVLLKRVGQALKGFGRRSGDLAARYDEEQLAIILPWCSARDAIRMAEALKKRVESFKIPHASAENRDMVSIHIGVATVKPGRERPVAELIEHASAALAEAGAQGNRFAAYQPLRHLKRQRWDQLNDGPLNEQSFIQKLLQWSYDSTRVTVASNTGPHRHLSTDETVVAWLEGDCVLEIDGHLMAVNRGDFLFVPANTQIVIHAKTGSSAIVYFATRN